MPAEPPLFWILSEVDHHLTYPHPANGLPVVLVFSSKARIEAFFAANPQRHCIAKGVVEHDLKTVLRQWVYGGIQYFAVDPEGAQAQWAAEPLSAFRDAVVGMVAEGTRQDALEQVQAADAKAQRQAADVAELQDEVHAKLFPPPPAPPAPPPPPRPWYEAHGLD